MKVALEGLRSVGDVMVNKSHLGLALGSDGVMFPLGGNVNATSLFPVWTVEFDGMCSFPENVWGPCLANTGDLQVRFLICRRASLFIRYSKL